MLKKFLMKHYGLVELNELDKLAIKIGYILVIKDTTSEVNTKIILSRLNALGISYTYNKRDGIK